MAAQPDQIVSPSTLILAAPSLGPDINNVHTIFCGHLVAKVKRSCDSDVECVGRIGTVALPK